MSEISLGKGSIHVAVGMSVLCSNWVEGMYKSVFKEVEGRLVEGWVDDEG